jgi:hypothetical protein
MERVDGDGIGCCEGDVHVFARLAGHERDDRSVRLEERGSIRLSRPDLVADGGRDGCVEACRGLEVAHTQPDVVDGCAIGSSRLFVDGLDAVARRIGDKGTVVGGRVFGSGAGCAEVGMAGVAQRLPPGVDLHTVYGLEADVQAACQRPFVRCLGDRKVVPFDEAVTLVDPGLIKQGQRQRIERARLVKVADPDRDVVDHRGERTPMSAAFGGARL